LLIDSQARSYLHVEWVDQSVIDNSHMGRSRLQKFLAKETQQSIVDLNDNDVDDGQYFDSKCVEWRESRIASGCRLFYFSMLTC
jgi:hypothetical protein